MRIARYILTASIISIGLPALATAQTADTSKSKPAPAEKTQPAKKPKMDLDGFFKDAEKQTRKAQDEGNSNCVPKPKETSTEPVT